MTSTTAAQVPVPSTPRVALETAVVRNWKAPVAFGIFSVLAFVLLNARLSASILISDG